MLLRLFFFLLSHERYELTPSATLVAHLILTVQFVDILLAQEYDFLS